MITIRPKNPSERVYDAEEIRQMEIDLQRLSRLYCETSDESYKRAYERMHSAWIYAKRQKRLF